MPQECRQQVALPSGSAKVKKAVPFVPSFDFVRRTSGTEVSIVPFTNWMVAAARTATEAARPAVAARGAARERRARVDAMRVGEARA